MPKTEKRCPACKTTKAIGEFVNIYGYENSRGKYCRECFDARQKQEAKDLMDGRDSCIYCGLVIEKVRDYSPEGKPTATYLHGDHMDPVSLGGYDPDTYDLDLGDFPTDRNRNIVYCCAACNMKKKDKLFVDWLKELAPEYRQLAREIYVQKNGRNPEDFKPDEPINIEIRVEGFD